MTAFYMRQFKKNNPCPWCPKHKPNPRVPQMSLCTEHLKICRDRFRAWSIERRELHLCIRCNHKSFMGFLRCKSHTILNREQCKAWMAIHQHEQWLKAKKYTEETGKCYRCAEHNPVIPDTYRCKPCDDRRRARDRARRLNHQ